MTLIVVDRELEARLRRLAKVSHPGLKRHANAILNDLITSKASSRGVPGDGHYLKTPTGTYELHKVGRKLVLTAYAQRTKTIYTLGWFGFVQVN